MTKSTPTFAEVWGLPWSIGQAPGSCRYKKCKRKPLWVRQHNRFPVKVAVCAHHRWTERSHNFCYFSMPPTGFELDESPLQIPWADYILRIGLRCWVCSNEAPTRIFSSDNAAVAKLSCGLHVPIGTPYYPFESGLATETAEATPAETAPVVEGPSERERMAAFFRRPENGQKRRMERLCICITVPKPGCVVHWTNDD